MKKIYLFAFAAMAALQVQAQSATQDTYVGAALATEDLNGTARYVGMGGAMDALGAEQISPRWEATLQVSVCSVGVRFQHR